ncbi:MAG: tetratricopeptide repeat protein [Desulfomonile tiedjei]|nr:tetratricopeptide repeat protein [Desulfomonile tiedjei]
MDAVTYPNKKVVEFVRKNVIPMRVQHDQPLASRFRVKWTPTLILLDDQGNEVYRNEGFLPPERLVPALMLGMGKVNLESANYDKAISHFKDLVSRYPQSEEAPEAVYFQGVARFRTTKDLKAMKEAYETLSKQYPNSSWTRKAQPYDKLK